MKPTTIFNLLVLFLLVSHVAQAKVLRVNADLPPDEANGLFSSLSQAHNHASAGDTLLLEGANNSYGDATITKRLVILGPGFLLDENQQLITAPIYPLPALVRRIVFDSGSEGSIVSGLTMVPTGTTSAIVVLANDITISRNRIRQITIGNIESLTISQNYFIFDSPIDPISDNYTFSGVVVKNNIFLYGLNVWLNRVTHSFAIVENNTILRSGSGAVSINIRAELFQNNIIGENINSINITSGTNGIRYNLSKQLAASHGEYNNMDFDSSTNLFENHSSGSDWGYRLKDNAHYKTAGYNNAEPGAFGGPTPYVVSGLSTVPVIYDLHAESVTTQADGLRVQVKAKMN